MPIVESPQERCVKVVIMAGRSIIVDLYPAVTERVNDGGGTVVDGELFEDGGDVIFHGLVANFERLGDLLVAIATRNIVENLYFATGKRRVEVFCLSIVFFNRKLAERFEHAAGELRF